MDVRSTTKYAHISSKKARDVAREIQGLPVSDALDTLTFTPRKSAHLIGKTLKSAIANAENNHDLIADDLIVKSATVTEGPSQRRFKPRARGSAGAIIKRTAHINIVLSDEYEAPEEKNRIARKDKKRNTAKSLFSGKAKAPKKEEPVVAAEEAAPETEETEEQNA